MYTGNCIESSNLSFTATFSKRKPLIFLERVRGLWFLLHGKRPCGGLVCESTPLRASRFAYTRSMAGVLQKINLSPFPILYMTDAAQNEADVDSLRKALKDSKGPGNFRNLFVYSPNGKKDGLQIIPVSEVTAKDEFNSIKNQTRDDVLASLRIPPQLMGIVPQNAGGFGSIREAAQIYAANELEPIQARMAQVNEWLGEEVVRFNPYAVPAGA